MILYEPDHINRALNLASKLNEQAADITSYSEFKLGGNTPIPTCTDAILTIWGHGGPNTFAQQTPAVLQTFISAWKKTNKQLTTVDIVTCDVRHVQNGQNSYIDQLMPLLILSSKLLVKIRTLPRGGSDATWSVLYACEERNKDGYYFVAGTTEEAMKKGEDVLNDAEKQVSGTPAYNSADKFMAALRIAEVLNNEAAKKGKVEYVSSSGSLTKLRDALVLVTTYVGKDRKIIAVPSMLGRNQLPALNHLLAAARASGGSMTTRSQLITLRDMLATANSHPFGLHASLALGADPPPATLFDMLHTDTQAPSSTVVAAVSVDDIKDPTLNEQLYDVMMLTSFISVAASRYLYQTIYKDRKPDITTPAGASEFVKAMANAKNFILTNAMGGYLSSESLLSRSYTQSTTSADLHMEFLATLFQGFNFPPATITELDSVLTSVTKNISDLKLSWSDQNSTLDHMVFLYYFDKVMGTEIKVPKVRIYFLHIDQSSWTASVGKSSVSHFNFNMNFMDGIYPMDVINTATDRDKIKKLLTTLTGQSMEDLNKLLSPSVVNPNPT
ncbi:hypothetical protein [Microcoleus sp. Pol12B4]|uniref:hypothetical protein n=1 Tax=Microcoleus sp. Pol12B4 TaxID=3055395 RepID=UPI002FD4B020